MPAGLDGLHELGINPNCRREMIKNQTNDVMGNETQTHLEPSRNVSEDTRIEGVKEK